MAVSRTSANLGRTVLRRAATQSRTQAWRTTARRYASHGTASAEKAKKTSDIPWLIGSVAFTVPAAVWLLGQGPEKSSHHHDSSHKSEEEEGKEEDAPAEEPSEGGSEEGSDQDKKDEAEDKGEEKEEKSSGGDDAKTEDSSSEGSDGEDGKDTPDTSEDESDGPSAGSPGQINYKPGMNKGPGEGQKGTRKPSEKKGEKDSASDKSGAQNPYLDDDEKSKKGEGLKETQKIHGTVDSSRPAR